MKAPGPGLFPNQCPNARDVIRCKLGVCCAYSEQCMYRWHASMNVHERMYRRAKPGNTAGQVVKIN